MMKDSARGNFRKVVPLDTGALPYWQAGPSQQPRFLQAAALQRTERWSELERLSREWAALEPADAEPWSLLGLALERQGVHVEAEVALEVRLDLAERHAVERLREQRERGLRAHRVGAADEGGGGSVGPRPQPRVELSAFSCRSVRWSPSCAARESRAPSTREA